MTKLFHRDVWFPSRIIRQLAALQGKRPLEYSQHAIRECSRDRFGMFSLPNPLDLSKFEVFEVEEENKVIVKVVGRYPLDETRDVVLACMFRAGVWFVKTAWINLRDDQHRTLRANQYMQKP